MISVLPVRGTYNVNFHRPSVTHSFPQPMQQKQHTTMANYVHIIIMVTPYYNYFLVNTPWQSEQADEYFRHA